ncbi:MAG: sulfite exporter TauE/SafE family protein [Caldilineaceae bacterium]
MRLKSSRFNALPRLVPVLPAVLLALVVAVATPVAASAHPLGNFTVNRYSRLSVGTGQLQLLYVLDMAEIPAHAERAQIDTNGDGELSPAEVDRYRTAAAEALLYGVELEIDGTVIPLELQSAALSFPSGQAGLPTLRLEVTAHTAALRAGEHNVRYADQNYGDRLGWQEIVASAEPGVTLANASVPAQDRSHALKVYPQDLLNDPPRVSAATFVWKAAAGTGAGAGDAVVKSTATGSAGANTGVISGRSGRPSDPFADLIAIPQLGLGAVLLALAAAFGWGALHAMSPGHGKTLVAAYLVGAHGTARHALFLGLTTTITHTAGVFALGFVTLALSRYVLPEQLYPWLSAASGILVVVIGLSLARRRLFGDAHQHDHDHHHEHHAHEHGHEHSHEHGHEHGHGDEHEHTHEDQHHHGHGHSHLPPGADGRPVTWRGLLALGISGGLLPCPSALVLMLGAISLNRIGFGLLLIVSFSIGLASVLTLFGIALVHAGKWFERIPEGGRLIRFVPAASALFITAAGLVITLEALGQVYPLGGLLPS